LHILAAAFAGFTFPALGQEPLDPRERIAVVQVVYENRPPSRRLPKAEQRRHVRSVRRTGRRAPAWPGAHPKQTPEL